MRTGNDEAVVMYDIRLAHKESFEWVEKLKGAGVRVSLAWGMARVVEDVFGRLEARKAGVKLRHLYRWVTNGIFTGVFPLFAAGTFDAVVSAFGGEGEEAGDGGAEAGDMVVTAVAGLMSDAPKICGRVDSMLLAQEALCVEMKDALAMAQLLLVQQMQVLRRYYPFSGEEGISTELLGTRIVREGLGCGLLPKIYQGLDELVTALRFTSNWLAAWDVYLRPGLNLKQARHLFGLVEGILGVLSDETYKDLKRLYRLRWKELDGRMLAALETDFLWQPFSAVA